MLILMNESYLDINKILFRPTPIDLYINNI